LRGVRRGRWLLEATSTVSLLVPLKKVNTGKPSHSNEDRTMFIEVDDTTYKKLLEYCAGRDINTSIYSLLVWAQSQPRVSGTVKTISKYYDTEKYKRTAAADIKHAAQTKEQDPTQR
jgi:hypothetical protein